MITTVINQKCMAPRLRGSSCKYKAILIAFVPANEPGERYTHCAGDTVGMWYTVDALVCLQELDVGRLVQVPVFEVKCVIEWPEREE